MPRLWIASLLVACPLLAGGCCHTGGCCGGGSCAPSWGGSAPPYATAPYTVPSSPAYAPGGLPGPAGYSGAAPANVPR